MTSRMGISKVSLTLSIRINVVVWMDLIIDFLSHTFLRSVKVGFPGMPPQNIRACAYVGGKHRERDLWFHSHSVATGGELLMKGTDYRDALSELGAYCASVYI